jgi:hypothetical protein
MNLATNEENIESSDEDETMDLPAEGRKQVQSQLNVSSTLSSFKG